MRVILLKAAAVGPPGASEGSRQGQGRWEGRNYFNSLRYMLTPQRGAACFPSPSMPGVETQT
jgi:hypothetical protein